MRLILQILSFAILFISPFQGYAQIKVSQPDSAPQYVEPVEVKNFNATLFSNDSASYTAFPAENLDAKKTEAIKNSDALAMYAIGMMYFQGANVEIDFKQAKEWFSLAAKEGNTDAMIQLSKILAGDKEITKLEPDTLGAKKWIEQAVRERNSNAYMEIGRMYETGFLYDINVPKALKFYQLAAQAGNVNAYAKLSSIYLFARGVDQDLRKAINYLRLLKKFSISNEVKIQADVYLAQIYFDTALSLPNGKTKFDFFMLSWDHGNKQAADAVAEMYYTGAGIRKDYLKARSWFEKSAAMESPYAYEKLGQMYLDAPGDIERDYKKSMEYFQKSARLGSSRGAYMIAYHYENGLGVPKDENQAKTWYTRSETLRTRAKDSYNKKIQFTTPKF